MGNLAPLLAGLITGEVKAVAVRTKRLAILYIVAALFALLATGAASVALGLYLARHMRPEHAALVLAAIFLALSALVLAATTMWNARERRRHRAKAIAPKIAMAAALTLLPAMVSNRSAFALASAAFAGYALMRSRQHRYRHAVKPK